VQVSLIAGIDFTGGQKRTIDRRADLTSPRTVSQNFPDLFLPMGGPFQSNHKGFGVHVASCSNWGTDIRSRKLSVLSKAAQDQSAFSGGDSDSGRLNFSHAYCPMKPLPEILIVSLN
jgi:hypothetical protein